MPTIQDAIVRTVKLKGRDILGNKNALCVVLEDLAPDLSKERDFIEQVYGNEVGKLFCEACASDLAKKNEYLREVDRYLDEEDGRNESWRKRLISFFEVAVMGSEQKSIYEWADSLYSAAVSAADFIAAADRFSEILDYKDSKKKYESCKRKADMISSNERMYKEAADHWKSASEFESLGKWADSEKEYTLAEQQFEKIVSFKDSKQNIKKCQSAKKAMHEKAIYYQAEDVFEKATTIVDYERAARLFTIISEFSDAKAKYEMCLKRISEISIEQQYKVILERRAIAEKERSLDRRAELLKNLISTFENCVLSEKAKKEVDQCKLLLNECLEQIEDYRIQELFKNATAQYETADKLTDYPLRADAFSKILKEYKKDAKTDEFVQLISKCQDKLEEANGYVAYDAAVELMNKAKSEHEFKSAADAFAALSSFKDSDTKKEICMKHVEECVSEEVYNSALAKISQGKKITLFNWRKYQ